jgi:hypothetical protein
VLNGLAGLTLPTDWSYSSEVLTSSLTVVTHDDGVARVRSMVSGGFTFQRLLVPEPGVAGLLAVGLGLVAWRQRR